MQEENLKEIIKSLCKLDLSEAEMDNILAEKECNLKDSMGFDSLLMVELIVEIEEQFGFEFTAEEMSIKRLQLYGTISSIVKKI